MSSASIAKMIDTLGAMITINTTIVNKLGLHARAAAKFVNCASEFSASVRLRRGSKEVNGKSIMGVMTLAAAMGTELVLIIDGEDEHEAQAAITTLIANRFGENE